MDLREALDLSATGALRRMAIVHGLPSDASATRAELIDRLAERLRDEAYLVETVRRLSDDERAALTAARSSGGTQRGMLIDHDHPGAVDALVERGLLFRVFAAAGPRRGEVFSVPDEVLALLPEPPPPEPPPATEPEPDERRASDPVFSLFCLASILGRHPGGRVEVLEPDVRPWAAEPGGWDWEARWTFLRHLGLAAGLLAHRADGAVVAGPSLARLLDDPPALSERVWRTYLNDRTWSELAHAWHATNQALHAADRVGEEDGPPRTGVAGDELAELADYVQLRRALREAVEQLPIGGWISVVAFSGWLQRTRPMLVREQLNARGQVLLESADWSGVELPVLRYWLLGPLYWLGVISASPEGLLVARRGQAPSILARPDSDASQEALHLDSVGSASSPSPAAVASPPLQPASVQAQPEPCTWEGAAELVAPPRAALGTLLETERYLVLHERGRPSRYHLVQSHVAAALGGGGSIRECRALLGKLTRGPLPEVVSERLVAWEQRFGSLGVRPAVLLEARTTAELESAIGDARVRPFVRGRLGPTVAEVAAADVLELAAALRESDHLPRVDAALRLASEPRRAYGSLVDEQVLEFLLVSLLAFQAARPERLSELEGSLSLIERLQRQFSQDRLSELRRAAARLAGQLSAAPPPPRSSARRRARRRGTAR